MPKREELERKFRPANGGDGGLSLDEILQATLRHGRSLLAARPWRRVDLRQRWSLCALQQSHTSPNKATPPQKKGNRRNFALLDRRWR
jgi:hypothetical protein